MLPGTDAGYPPPVVSLRLLGPYYIMYVIPIQCPFGKLCRQERGVAAVASGGEADIWETARVRSVV